MSAGLTTSPATSLLEACTRFVITTLEDGFRVLCDASARYPSDFVMLMPAGMLLLGIGVTYYLFRHTGESRANDPVAVHAVPDDGRRARDRGHVDGHPRHMHLPS